MLGKRTRLSRVQVCVQMCLEPAVGRCLSSTRQVFTGSAPARVCQVKGDDPGWQLE